MTTPDAVREMLRERGCPAWLVNGGLPALIERWGGIVTSVETGYPFTLDDYLNDLDLRGLLQAALEVAGDSADESRAQVAAIDDRFRAATEKSPCLWGSDVEFEEGHSPDREWWYYRRPSQLTEELREELESWGLL